MINGERGTGIEHEPSIITNPWEVMPHESFLEQMGHLNELLEEKDPGEVLKAMKDPLFLRTAVIEKGEGLAHLSSIQKGVNVILSERFGPDINLGNIQTDQLNQLQAELDLPNTFWTELTETAFHQDDRSLFEHLTHVVSQADLDSLSQVRSQHDIASWAESRDNNPTQALEINKQILSKGGLNPIFEQKVRLGIVWDRFKSGSQFPDMPQKMALIAEQLRRLNTPTEAGKCFVIAAEAALNLYSLDESLEYAERGLELSSQHHYPNSTLSAETVLAKIQNIRGENWQGSVKLIRMADSLDKLGGHAQEIGAEIRAEVEKSRPYRLLLEIGNNNFLVRTGNEKEPALLLPEISIKGSKNAQKKVIKQIEILLCTELKGKKKNKYRQLGNKDRILEGGIEQTVHLGHYKINDGINAEALTNLTNSGYSLLSGEEIKERKDGFDPLSSALIDALE